MGEQNVSMSRGCRRSNPSRSRSRRRRRILWAVLTTIEHSQAWKACPFLRWSRPSSASTKASCTRSLASTPGPSSRRASRLTMGAWRAKSVCLAIPSPATAAATSVASVSSGPGRGISLPAKLRFILTERPHAFPRMFHATCLTGEMPNPSRQVTQPCMDTAPRPTSEGLNSRWSSS